MPRKPIIDKKLPVVADGVWAFLNDAHPDPRHDFGVLMLTHPDHPGPLQKLWKEHRTAILAAWQKRAPGTRPSCWWKFDAPRLPDQGTGAWFEGTLQLPRERVGGVGVLSWERQRVKPWFVCGMPHSDSWLEIDLQDPPRFEAQAAYLKRHGLLTPAERRAIVHRPEAWEPETIDTTDFTEE